MMRRRAGLACATLVAGSWMAAGCSTLPPREPADNGVASQIVTREQIQASGAGTLWDVLRCCTDLGLVEGRGRDVRHRGSNSLVLSNTPLIVVDGIRVGDLASLSTMPADELEVVRVYSAAEASGQFGIGSDNGVIEILTRRDTP